MPWDRQGKVAIENVNRPGKVRWVDASLYESVRLAFLSVLPAEAPGMTARQVTEAIRPMLPERLFPEGKDAARWTRLVQRDLEAKQVIRREGKRPVRFSLTSPASRPSGG